MRKEFSRWAENYGKDHSNFIFLTGDLGFNALENVKTAISERFINVGVSEQNMVSMAAALAQQGLSPLCYSIAPFAVFRPTEQIRVDVCLHKMNVKIVGNGGGYGYGIMGATHHAIEDIGVLSGFSNIKCFIPFCNQAVETIADEMMAYNGPSYLRLGFGLAPEGLLPFLSYAPIQKLCSGSEFTVIGMGPVILNAIEALKLSGVSADVFSINELPLKKLSSSIVESIKSTSKVLVIEEHVARGGLGEHLALLFCKEKLRINCFKHISALGYPSGLYGNQLFHQAESGLDPESIQKYFFSV